MRIASLSPAITEILFALQLQDKLVCTDQFSDYPDDAQCIPHVPDSIYDDIRELYDYDVNIVFTSKVSENLKRGEFSVSVHNPQSINEVYEMIRSIGMMMQCEDKSEALVLRMQQGFKDIKRKSSLLQKRLCVYIEHGDNPWIKEVAHIAGLEQVTGEDTADIVVAKGARNIDMSLLKRPGPRLVDGSRYLYGWAFEKLH